MDATGQDEWLKHVIDSLQTDEVGASATSSNMDATGQNEWLKHVKDKMAAFATSSNMDATGQDEWLKRVIDSLMKDEVGTSATNSELSKPKAYIPQVVSIGPYHHRSSERYKKTDADKVKMAMALQRKLRGFQFKELVNHIGALDHETRVFYDKHIPYDLENLSLMLALDTTFILEFLMSIFRSFPLNEDNQSDPILSRRKTPLWYAMQNDILMLENQVPMFLLIETLRLISKDIQSDTQVRSTSQIEITQNHRTFQPHTQAGSTNQSERWQDYRVIQIREHLIEILQVACLHFNPFLLSMDNFPIPVDLDATRHVLGYLYHFVTYETLPEPRQSEIQVSRNMFSNWGTMKSPPAAENLPSATKLHEAGIKFAAYSSGRLREISFNRRSSTFLLPKIRINSSTEVVLRNLAALELNLQTDQKPLTRYIYLTDSLINTKRDVAVLKRCGVLYNQMGSDKEVAKMWNPISMSIGQHTFEPVDNAIEAAIKKYKTRSKYGRFLWAEFLLFFIAVQVFCLFYSAIKKFSSTDKVTVPM